jgi:PAS domain S-box-containing protein
MVRLKGMLPRLRTYWPILLSGALALYLLWIWRTPSSFHQNILGWAFVLAARTGAALTTIRTSKKLEHPEAQTSWNFIGVGLALWVVSDAVNLLTLLFTGSLPNVPAFSDLCLLAGYFALLTFSARYPATPPERFGRLRASLDLTILGVSVSAFVWFVFIRPVLDVGLGDGVRIFWIVVNPGFDLVLLIYIIRLSLLSNHWQESVAFRLLAAAISLLAVGDLFRGYRLLQGGTGVSGVQEAVWVIGSMFIVLANRRRVLVTGDISEARPSSRIVRYGPRIESLMPVALTYIVVGITAYDWWLGKQVDWVGIAASGLLSLLLVARQGVLGGQFEMRQYAALVTSSADMAFICQLDGAFRLANPALREVLGIQEREVREANLSDLFPSADEFERVLDAAKDDGWIGEIHFQRSDGAVFPVFLSLRPVHGIRKVQSLLAGTAHDLTTIREREQALRQALSEVANARASLEKLNLELEGKVEERTEELERTVADLARLNEDLQALDRLKSEFVALVSHELRAPLTNISSGIELILEGHTGLDASSHQSLKLVQAETRRLSHFVEAILDLSALEAGRFTLDESPASIRSTAERVRIRIPSELEEERLRIEIDKRIPYVLADEGALESVLFHLIDNALKYATEGDVIIDSWQESGYVYTAVSDSGPGIPVEERKNVFDLFHRLDSRDSREVYGYGLGLPMVHRLLEAMSGGVRIEESETGGARMVFWLPIASDEDGVDKQLRMSTSDVR